MNYVELIERELRTGRLADTLAVIQRTPDRREHRNRIAVLQAWVLERLGRLSEAAKAADAVVHTKNASGTDLAGATCVLARVAHDRGRTDDALSMFQRAESLAESNDELRWLMWARLGLLNIVSERSGYNATTSIVTQLRLTTVKAADIQLTAAMHAYIGQIEGMAGLLDSAERRSKLALKLLESEPNVSLQAVAMNSLLAIAFLRSNVETGLLLGPQAIEFAHASQSAASMRAALGNMGNLFLLKGDLDSSADHIDRALKALRPEENIGFGLIDGLARIRLAQERTDDCEALLDSVAQSMHTTDDRTLYVFRHSLLTKSALLLYQGKFAGALTCADEALSLARYCGDQLLLALALLARVEVLSSLGDMRGASAALIEVGPGIGTAPPSIRGEYHRVLACASLREGLAMEATRHAKWATQIYFEIGNQFGISQVVRSLDRVRSRVTVATSVDTTRDLAMTLQAVAELFAQTTNTRVEAIELSTLLTLGGAAESVDVIDLAEPETWKSDDSRDTDWASIVRLDDRVQLRLEPKSDISSAASLNAANALVEAVREVRYARAAAERQAAIWPPEADPDADLNAVIVGHMNEQAAVVRRVARTTVIVLLLGDSGTGKEILARAVHEYSDRAGKPFIPVNCAALPGHLLESTLFGYRRGAFTGADRDNPGLIRAAAGGTLFLDEIGELGLELQPKLLRFLESGEIAPLGELTTTRVNVRIVCATNRNLASLVQQGLFREDLFYRINVVRLTMKPLRERRDEIPSLVTHFVAAAAREFAKGYVPVAEETMERLLLYRWPGNIRQLQNEIRRMVALVEPSATLEPDMISDEILDALPLLRPTSKRRAEIAVSLEEKLPSAVARIESEMIKAALREHHGRVDAVAKALGISRKGLYLKRQRLGV